MACVLFNIHGMHGITNETSTSTRLLVVWPVHDYFIQDFGLEFFIFVLAKNSDSLCTMKGKVLDFACACTHMFCISPQHMLDQDN